MGTARGEWGEVRGRWPAAAGEEARARRAAEVAWEHSWAGRRLEGVLMILESYPARLDTGGPALPTGGGSFRAACERWDVPADLLARVPRINALERAPGRRALDQAQQRQAALRVGAGIELVAPRLIIAAGWVARDAVGNLLGLARRPAWLEVVEAWLPGGATRILVIPHYSGASRLTNEGPMRCAVSAVLRAELMAAAAALH